MALGHRRRQLSSRAGLPTGLIDSKMTTTTKISKALIENADDLEQFDADAGPNDK